MWGAGAPVATGAELVDRKRARKAQCAESCGAIGDKAPKLTPRQRDCVVLAARGKSSWVSGQLLGLSADTVHKYLESAKRRYGVSSRTELVVRTLHDGQLSFEDVMGQG